MPLLCVGERRSPSQLDDEDEAAEGDDADGNTASFWQEMPDSILLHIFSFLDFKHLCNAGAVCLTWYRVSVDETLWKDLFLKQNSLDSCMLAPGKQSWRSEVRRIHDNAPVVLTEKLTDHTDEVLHVSFSHNGQMFSTTSKDATLKIWEMGYPTKLKYTKDFRGLLGWDFTQFSCFNESDTMVLVSSVKSTAIMDRRGYMAILSITNNFRILRVVTMDPSQLFGAWLDNTTFLGGTLEISLDRFATTVQIEAHEVHVPDTFSITQVPEPVPRIEESQGRPLFTFSSESASLIKFLTVSRAIPAASHCCHESRCTSHTTRESSSSGSGTSQSGIGLSSVGSGTSQSGIGLSSSGSGTSYLNCDICMKTTSQDSMETEVDGCYCDNVNGSDKCLNCVHSGSDVNCSKTVSAIKPVCEDLCDAEMNEGQELDSRNIEAEHALIDKCNLDSLESVPKYLSQAQSASSFHASNEKKLKNLIFVTGEFAVALHQLGFKNIPPHRESLSKGTMEFDQNNMEAYNMVVNYSNNDIHIVQRQQEPDKPDHLIDLYGHVTGLCLTPDQRYLFINCRPWTGDIDRTDPWATPELSPNIEVRIIDLHTLKDVGVQYHGHKGFSPSNMCCFVFLDVSSDYVASGSEDAKGYLWDRHYRCLLTNYIHDCGVVNAVAFSPANQEYLVTASDDKTLKVWRSRAEVRRLQIPVLEEEEPQ